MQANKTLDSSTTCGQKHMIKNTISLKFRLLRLSVEQGTSEVWWQSFAVKTTLLSRATCYVSNGNLSVIGRHQLKRVGPELSVSFGWSSWHMSQIGPTNTEFLFVWYRGGHLACVAGVRRGRGRGFRRARTQRAREEGGKGTPAMAPLFSPTCLLTVKYLAVK